MPNDPRWLLIEVVIEINRTVVTRTGERHFLRDAGLLDSAMARPQNAFAYGEEDIVALAVRLLAGLAQAHAFEQGNKRTSFIAMIEFLMINGYDPAIDDTVTWADEVIALVEHRSPEDDFVRAIRPFVVPR
ncbi:MAG TPA: type II toxin-antitoxin system death-on-curing family toxin [Stellaceae bacterium]|nr:type II toxin-antitoxin system death-on-curing family toxin [Stellaceae bacterium]